MTVRRNHNWLSQQNRDETLVGLLFVLPVLVGFLAFVAAPIASTVALSFTSYDLFSPPQFVGLKNFVRMSADARLWKVFGNTVFFTLWAVIGNTAVGVILAAVLNQKLPSAIKSVFRAAYFFPSLVGLIFVSIIWQFLYQRDIGVINYYLALVGLGPIGWLSDPKFALVSVIILDVWKNAGFSMLIALAGLQGISSEYYEAARIDGAGPVRTFVSITLPLLSPTILFLVTTNTIGSFRVFESIIVLTNGGPGDATRSLVMYIYETGFKAFKMGYASAISMLLLGVVVLVTVLQFRFAKRWTFYE